ncbi:MAG TPA: cysteine desulfurase [Deltaproteobacteria bacterium]|nr:cysteine desulfurase [Deltaproteobacteria bacterium]
MTDGDPIYLDHNATTPLLPEVLDAMLPWLRDGFANPSSDHRGGRRARRALDEAREALGALLGAPPASVCFTSGGTESNNLAIFGTLAAIPGRPGVVTSTLEHPAVAEPCRALAGRGHPLTWLPAGSDGRIQLPDALPADTALATVMLANNETGALQPVEELCGLARQVGALIHTDAAQAVGKVPIQFDALGVDLLTVAGHKLYAPKGIGALVIRPGTPIRSLLLGAGHEGGLRPGTENVASIVALGVAARLAAADLEAEIARQRALSERLWASLQRRIPGLRRTIAPQLALANTLHVRFPGVVGARILARTPQLAASTGSACHAGETHPSAVLLAMGLEPMDALGAVRLSLGRSTTEAQIDRAAEALGDAYLSCAA